MMVLDKNGRKGRFGRKCSKLPVPPENGRKCRFWPKMVGIADPALKWLIMPILAENADFSEKAYFDRKWE